MANGIFKVEMRLRPCIIYEKFESKKALFHRWSTQAQVIPPSPFVGGHTGGQIYNTYGIVELEDGTVIEVPPQQIRFLDNSHEEFAWPDTKDFK